jgi:hypothetical protein
LLLKILRLNLLAMNQDNVSEFSDISTHGLLFQFVLDQHIVLAH